MIKLHADEAYGDRGVRRYLRQRGANTRIGVDPSEHLDRYRWVVERTIAWLLVFRRLAVRCDRNAVTITAVASLAITIIGVCRLPHKDY